MPPRTPSVWRPTGRRSAESRRTANFGARVRGREIPLFVFPEELEVVGDVAIDQHKWVLNSMPKRGGRPIHDEGKGVWIWRRQMDGSWKVARAIWNSDLSRAGFQTGSNTELTEDLAALNRILDEFVVTVNAGDAEGWGALMTDRFHLRGADAPRFVGRENAVAAAKAGFFDPFVLKLANKFEDVQIFDERLRPRDFPARPDPQGRRQDDVASGELHRTSSASRATAGNTRS